MNFPTFIKQKQDKDIAGGSESSIPFIAMILKG